MEIYTRALRCAVRPGPHRLQGDAEAGRRRRRARGGAQAAPGAPLRACCSAGGTALRLLDLAGVGPLPDLPGIAAVIVPLLGLIELRRVAAHAARGRAAPPAAARLPLRGRRARPLLLRRTATSPAGSSTPAPRASAWCSTRRCESARRPAVLLELRGRGRARRTRSPPQVEVRSCREADGRYLVGATIDEIDPASRMRLMEWCYVVCSHERLRGHRPARRRPARPSRSSSARRRAEPTLALVG